MSGSALSVALRGSPATYVVSSGVPHLTNLEIFPGELEGFSPFYVPHFLIVVSEILTP